MFYVLRLCYTSRKQNVAYLVNILCTKNFIQKVYYPYFYNSNNIVLCIYKCTNILILSSYNNILNNKENSSKDRYYALKTLNLEILSLYT